jgi:nucleoside-diphosphate-sugar epimerase
MKILILGGHGFIGHNLSRMLLDQGHEVHVVDCHHDYGEYPQWEFDTVMKQRVDYIGDHAIWFGDVTNKDFMHRVFMEVQPERVIDLATYPNARMVKKNVMDATVNMVAATALALELCVQFKVDRFVLASSSMVYGDFDKFDGQPNETSECDPLTLYGSYKLQAERMCKIWHKEYGLNYTILRPSALYGPRDMVVRVISKMTVDAMIDHVITVNGPDNRLDFSFVTDVAAAFAAATLHPDAANEIFNCTRGNGRTIGEAAEIIQRRILCRVEYAPADSFYPNRDTLDSSKLTAVTGWRPSVDIEQGIEQYLDWFLKQPYLLRF